MAAPAVGETSVDSNDETLPDFPFDSGITESDDPNPTLRPDGILGSAVEISSILPADLVIELEPETFF